MQILAGPCGSGMAVTLGPVLAHIHPTGLTGSLSQTPLCMHHQPRGSLPGKYLLTRSRRAERQVPCQQSGRVSSSGCHRQVLQEPSAPGRRRTVPGPLCNWKQAEAEAGLDPTLSLPAIVRCHQVRGLVLVQFRACQCHRLRCMELTGHPRQRGSVAVQAPWPCSAADGFRAQILT